LVNSGFPSDRFCFEGFLPQKKGRQKRLQELSEETRTIIFYESPFRILKLLNEIIMYFGGDRPVSLSRELTKMFEENLRGTAAGLAEQLKDRTIKGEIVLVIHGKDK
jgi:16S rRNA (cytidine1402-2'-O)-methyltransferase